MKTPLNIVWFRHDLRLSDNPALYAAAQSANVLPIFIYDTVIEEEIALGAASKWWLHHALSRLNESLSGKLQIFKGDPNVIFDNLLNQYAVSGVYWNRTYEPLQIARDKTLKTSIKNRGVHCESFNGSLLWEPWTINKPNGEPYKVFTPYYRRGCLNADQPRYPLATPANMTLHPILLNNAIDLQRLSLLPSIAWDREFYSNWSPGEEAAKSLLSTFIESAAQQYKNQRDLPAVKGTSRLSAYLRWGEISPNQVWFALLDKFGGMDNEGIDCYLSELGWREFNYYFLFHFPKLQTTNYSAKFTHFPWQHNTEYLRAWQRGITGIPIVDAGMRQLWQTGYMHNRVRMVVSSFLVKNLLIDWRAGEQWFWDCLCDADMASNSAGWQWSAGCGADAAPYFRVFNPVLQGEKFDKAGDYVKAYCPELGKLPAKYIHKPWQAPQAILDAIGLRLGVDYPKPIVDLKLSRQRALDAFASLKSGAE